MLRPIHVALAWLLLTAQVVTLFAHPVGVVVCRDADGTTHVERPSASCCITDESEPKGAARAETEDTRSDRACDEGSCEDRLVGLDGAVPKMRDRVLTPEAAAPAAWISGVSTTRIVRRSGPERGPRGLADSGPPGQTRLLLGSTVLIL